MNVNVLVSFSIVILIVLTIHALTIHTMAGELNPLEIVIIEILWLPLLLYSREMNDEERKGLFVLFASYSGYFLPRLLELLPHDLLLMFFLLDVVFNNWIFSHLGLNFRMI